MGRSTADRGQRWRGVATHAVLNGLAAVASLGSQSSSQPMWRRAATTATDWIWPIKFARRVMTALEQPENPPPDPGSRRVPDGFPADVPLFRTRFEGFDGSLSLPGQWRAIPGDEAQLLALARWAQEHKATLRPIGAAHSWSPTMDSCDIAVDFRRFARIDIDVARRCATFGAGVTLEQASRAMESRGCMFADVPAIGEATVAGAAAMGTHGTGFTPPGGTLSAGLVAVRALVLDANPRFEWFRRVNPEFVFVAMHLGSLIVTELAFETVPATQFELVAQNISSAAYFGGRGRVTAADDAARQHAIELMWFPNQGGAPQGASLLRRAWRPTSRRTFVGRAPYSDLFVNFATRDTDRAVRDALGDPAVRRGVGCNLQWIFRLAAWRDRTQSAHAAQLYSSGFIVRFRAAGWCLVTSRDQVAGLLEHLARELHRFQERWGHAWTGPVEIRMTSVDPDDGPLLSAARSGDPRAVAIWFNALAEPSDECGLLMREIEDMLLGLPRSLVHSVRGEWSKAFGFDAWGKPWRDPRLAISLLDPATLAAARAIRKQLDPHDVCASPLARRLL